MKNENVAVVLTEEELQRQAAWEKIERNKNINLSRLGETVFQNCGELAYIVEYNSSTDVTVQFHKTSELVKTTYGKFVRGGVKSHFTPSVYGVGIVGLEPVINENGKIIDSYASWKSMLLRCYNKKYQQKQPSYIGCKVCEEWLYYPNFKAWYCNNYYEVDGEKMCLDKDILVKGNKIYSPETCIFVTSKINHLFIKSKASRGNCPIGVHQYTNGKYVAQSNDNSGTKRIINLGYYDTPNEAFNAYKEYKEQLIKDIANEYKEKIPANLYNALINYKVEIDD